MTKATPAPENDTGGGSISLGAIEILNAALVIIAALVFWRVSGIERAAGVITGGLISGGSFRIVVVVMKRILVPQRTKWWPVGIFWLKYMAIIGAVGYLILKVKLDIIGFLVGVTLIVPSILMVAVRQGTAREEQGK